MSNNVETFLDNLFDQDAKEQKERYLGKRIKGKIHLDRYGFRTKSIIGIVQDVYYSKSADDNIYVVKSDEDNKLYNIYQFNIKIKEEY